MSLTTTSEGRAADDRPYTPRLRVLTTTKDDAEPLIVLFTAPTVGTVVAASPTFPLQPGLWNDSWQDANFVDFVGRVTLTQT